MIISASWRTEQVELSSKLAKIARGYGLAIDTCAERLDLQQYGIEHARCIDDRLLAKLLGCRWMISGSIWNDIFA